MWKSKAMPKNYRFSRTASRVSSWPGLSGPRLARHGRGTHRSHARTRPLTGAALSRGTPSAGPSRDTE